MLGILRQLFGNPTITQSKAYEQLAKQSSQITQKVVWESTAVRVSVFAFLRTSWCLTKIRTTSASRGGGIPCDVTMKLPLLL